MDIANFSFMDGIRLSIFAMLVVFLILVLLQFIIYSFKFLPRDLGLKKSSDPDASAPESIESQDEDEMVAMLMASILAKEEFKGNIRVKSIKRIR